MSDRVEDFINSNAGKKILGALGISTPTELSRDSASANYFSGSLLLGASENAQLTSSIEAVLGQSNGNIVSAPAELLNTPKSDSDVLGDARYDALVFDGSGFKDATELVQAYRFFNGAIRKLNRNGRVVILGRPHRQTDSAEAAASQRALEGLSRSLGKEVGGKGATAQLITVEQGAEANLSSALRFVLSPRSAFVSGQVIRVENAKATADSNWEKPLENKVALVTGASRGIGQAIAETLARQGATVLGIDVPPMEAELNSVMAAINGKALVADITAADAPAKISETLKEMGGVDLVVHNAGVTRDKTIANMNEQWWQMTLDINLAAAQRINRALLETGALNDGGSIVGVSSMNGIGGQRGQTNYAASKAGVIGYVDTMSQDPALKAKGITVNAVAPGFIETAMTAAIPFFTRMVGRRLNSLSQGGQPVDVAETIAFFGYPESRGVNGNIVRVCGQNWLGA
ncbi:3-oxoacyl-ACP reductase [Spongiibacter sp. KMU-158]|uniref:3-oxoacyl-ACP reductase n=1 Tax=Spongiibacter pelagi TaxID=2760804 RepID=A0A927C1H3_9GAMM|nr:3-oxoacyl-ACP reductase [Spongiibacter pelagi]MBD2859545.1 3-oxoacyl-ACP reductase [Spongiibacter pelagi]